MRRRPSPSLVLSIVAVVFSLAGTSVAAITYVRNAGAVDGQSAVSWRSSQKQAAGKLVTTASTGTTAGKIPQRFIDLTGFMQGYKGTFHQALDVSDNLAGAPVAIGGFPGLGSLTAACNDQNNKAAIEDPQATIAFANTSGQTVNLTRTVGNGAATVTALANGTQDTFTINNANTFRLDVDLNGTNYSAEGAVRQDGSGTATGQCAIWGHSLLLTP
jgi:hypothetical protein